MRSSLKNGKLVEPKSLPLAIGRRQQLAHEIAHIKEQLADPERDTAIAWRGGAQRALTLFRSEERQLLEWIAGEQDKLLRQAHTLLSALRNDEVELEPSELQFIERLDSLFKQKETT